MSLQDVRLALDSGDKEEARRLLRDILQDDPSADAWMLAARAADDEHDTFKALKMALKFDPEHSEARQLYERMKALFPEEELTTEASTIEPETRSESTPAPQTSTSRRQRRGDTPISGGGSLPVSKLESQEVPLRFDGGSSIPSAGDSGEGVYEMLWDCRRCGTTGLLGKTHRHCPNCGAPQDPQWRYFPSDDQKVAVKDHVFVGADVTCPNCGSLNAGDANFCGTCGAPLDRAETVGLHGEREQAAGAAFATEDLQSRVNARLDAEARGETYVAAQGAPAKKKRNPYIIGGILTVIVAIIAGVLVAVFWTREESMVVSGFRWEREIEVEELRAVTANVVCDQMPAGAYSVTRRREQIDTRRVPDGETCRNVQVDNGDGTFRQRQECTTKYRNEPVYGDVCYYTIDQWQEDRTERATGDKSQSIVWPQVNLSCTGNRLGCEREGDRNEDYIIIFNMDGEQVECEVDPDMWQQTGIERVFTVKVGVIGGDARCDSLEPVQ